MTRNIMTRNIMTQKSRVNK